MKFLTELLENVYDAWTMSLVLHRGKLSKQEIAELQKLLDEMKDKS